MGGDAAPAMEPYPGRGRPAEEPPAGPSAGPHHRMGGLHGWQDPGRPAGPDWRSRKGLAAEQRGASISGQPTPRHGAQRATTWEAKLGGVRINIALRPPRVPRVGLGELNRAANRAASWGRPRGRATSKDAAGADDHSRSAAVAKANALEALVPRVKPWGWSRGRGTEPRPGAGRGVESRPGMRPERMTTPGAQPWLRQTPWKRSSPKLSPGDGAVAAGRSHVLEPAAR